MVSITAEIEIAEITKALGIFDNLSKVLVQRMFMMNFFRPFPDKLKFYFQDYKIVGRQNYTGSDSMTIGLRPGETDGTKAAILAYIVKAAPSHIDLSGVAKPDVAPEPELPPPDELEPIPEQEV